jgi:hypothetical protein
MTAARPAFSLESYEDESLPHDKRLAQEEDLKGHTILAMLMNVSGRLAGGTETVIVTETHCWMVLDTTDDQCHDERAEVVIDLGHSRWNSTKPEEKLQDYLSADELFSIGVIVSAERELLIAKETEAKQKKKADKADYLRKQLADIEGDES